MFAHDFQTANITPGEKIEQASRFYCYIVHNADKKKKQMVSIRRIGGLFFAIPQVTSVESYTITYYF